MAPARYTTSHFYKELHRDPVVSMEFSPNAQYLASIDCGHQLEPDNCDSEFSAYLVVWDLAASDGAPIPTYKYALEMKFGLAQVLWLDLGLVVAGRDGTLTVIAHEESTHMLHVLTFLAHPSLIHCMAFNKSMRQLLTASAEGLALWNSPGPLSISDVTGLTRLRQRLVENGDVANPFVTTGACWLNRTHFVIAYQRHPFVIWDVEKGTQLREISCQGQDPRVDASFFGSLAAVSYVRGRIDLYDMNTNFFSGDHVHGGLDHAPCKVIHSGRALIHGSQDGSVVFTRVDRIQAGTKDGSGTVVLKPEPFHEWPVGALAAMQNDDGFTIASGTRSPQGQLAQIQVWHAKFPRADPADKVLGRRAIVFICVCGLLGYLASIYARPWMYAGRKVTDM
ncbi:hypothetical protein AURDEDRAFT_164461 [Auricularia subglabra TFB-10046 SS5]|nr:hypothetical protein AURDEDRAFT_164461 [Auricularia subglabra TFB-10046 SS5]